MLVQFDLAYALGSNLLSINSFLLRYSPGWDKQTSPQLSWQYVSLFYAAGYTNVRTTGRSSSLVPAGLVLVYLRADRAEVSK